MNDISKSLLTINNAYEENDSIKMESDRSFPDLSDTYLSKEEQIKLYKKYIIESKDIDDVFFFLTGLTNLTNIKIDYNQIKKLAIEVIKDWHSFHGAVPTKQKLNCSSTIVTNAVYKDKISEEWAIKTIFNYNKNILKELIT